VALAFLVIICKVIVAFCIFQSSCSSASPSYVSEEFLLCKVDEMLDRVVKELISEAVFFLLLRKVNDCNFCCDLLCNKLFCFHGENKNVSDLTSRFCLEIIILLNEFENVVPSFFSEDDA
jgi:hypothetical protein